MGRKVLRRPSVVLRPLSRPGRAPSAAASWCSCTCSRAHPTTPFVWNFPHTGVDDNGRLRGAYTRSIGSIIESIAGIDGHSTRLASQVCRVTGFASISACPHVSCTPLSAPILLSAKLNLRQGRRKRRAVLWEARAQLSPCTARGQAPRMSPSGSPGIRVISMSKESREVPEEQTTRVRDLLPAHDKGDCVSSRSSHGTSASQPAGERRRPQNECASAHLLPGF